MDKWAAPYVVKMRPAVVASSPIYTRGMGISGTICPSTDNEPPPRQERDAVALPWLRQIRDSAGVRGRAREQFHT